MKRELFVCKCSDTDHMFVVVSPPEEEGEIWIHIHLRQDLNFFQRLKYAFLYWVNNLSMEPLEKLS